MGFPGEGPVTSNLLDQLEEDLQSSIPPLNPRHDMRVSLRRNLQHWRDIVQDPWANRIVAHGLKFQFYSRPPSYRKTRAPRNTIKPEFMEATRTTLQGYFRKNAIRKVPFDLKPGYTSSLLTVSKKDNSHRTCLNLRPLNHFMPDRHFKQEGLKTVKSLLRPGDWMIKIDLKDAYFHMAIHKDFRQFLRFVFQNQMYEFTCLPFGLKHAPWLFTKLIRKVLRILRQQGVRLVHFIDDFLLIGRDPQQLAHHAKLFLELFQKLGFVIHPEKSMLRPTQSIEFLGLVWDTNEGLIRLPEMKRRHLQRLAKRLLRSNQNRLRDLARWLGQLQFAAHSLPNSRLRSAHLLQHQRIMIRRHHSWSQPLILSSQARNELAWWIQYLDRPGTTPLFLEVQRRVIHGRWDASKSGWGGYARIHGRRVTASGKFHWRDSQQGNNVREALAQLYGWKQIIETHVPAHQRRKLLIRAGSDNATWVRYIQKQGGRLLHLNQPVHQLFLWAQQFDIRIQAYHVPGVQNRLADRLSRRFRNPYRIHLHQEWAQQNLWPITGVPQLDLFGTHQYHLAARYISFGPDPNALAPNPFHLDWTLLPDLTVAFPPPVLIPKILQRISQFSHRLILIVPWWPTQPWFPMLWPWIVDWPTLLPTSDVQMFSQPPRSPLIALTLSGAVWLRSTFQSRLPPRFSKAWADLPINTIEHGAPSQSSAKLIREIQDQLMRL